MKTCTTLSVTPLRLPRAVFAAIAALAPLHGFAAGEDKLSDLALEDLLRVTVSSVTRFEQPTTEAPASVTVIDNDELRQHGYRNLAEALATVPGVYTSGDRNYTFLGVRGFNRPGDYGTRILLLTDGARRNDPLYDQALLGNESPVEIDWVKRLEFVSGPASAIYGANALFGTANAVMLEGGDIDGTRITLDGGTSATRRLNVMAGQRLEDNRDWFVGFAAYKSHGEDLYFKDFDNGTTNGHANGLDGESYQKAYAKYRWGHWRLTGNYSWRDKNDPAANFGTTFGERGTNNVDESRLTNCAMKATPMTTGSLRSACTTATIASPGITTIHRQSTRATSRKPNGAVPNSAWPMPDSPSTSCPPASKRNGITVCCSAISSSARITRCSKQTTRRGRQRFISRTNGAFILSGC